MRYGFFGGSFDPPHLGHTLGCLWALETGQIDRVLLVPVARHAFGKTFGASFEHRLQMTRIATERLGDSVEVSAIEGRRQGVSFTVDTLRALAAERPGDTFRLIIGSDVARDLPKWRESTEVLRLAPPLEMPRPGDDAKFGDHPGALPPVSSTQVREAIAARSPLAQRLVGHAVLAYIHHHGLYTAEQRSSNKP